MGYDWLDKMKENKRKEEIFTKEKENHTMEKWLAKFHNDEHGHDSFILVEADSIARVVEKVEMELILLGYVLVYVSKCKGDEK